MSEFVMVVSKAGLWVSVKVLSKVVPTVLSVPMKAASMVVSMVVAWVDKRVAQMVLLELTMVVSTAVYLDESMASKMVEW